MEKESREKLVLFAIIKELRHAMKSILVNWNTN